MKKLSFILFAICLLLNSCSKDENTQEEESARLEKLYQEIIEYSQINSKPCNNPDEWTFSTFGPSNCTGYIVYHKSIDIAVFQQKINNYLVAKGKFDAKWGLYSLCVTTPRPVGLECKNEKALIIYTLASNQE